MGREAGQVYNNGSCTGAGTGLDEASFVGDEVVMEKRNRGGRGQKINTSTSFPSVLISWMCGPI